MEANLEYIAVALGTLYVLLAARGNRWCWPAGIASSALYIYINLVHHLFQDAILQTYYVAAGAYGWWLWAKKDEPEQEMQVQTFSIQFNVLLILFGAALVPVLGYGFGRLGNSLSYFDSAVTVFSFIATWLTAKKIIENWLYWIVIDMVAGAMYFKKELFATSCLYLFFCLVAVYGYFEWKKKMQRT